MALQPPAPVRGPDGLIGTIDHPEFADAAGPDDTVVVQLDTLRSFEVAARLLTRQADGSFFLKLADAEITQATGAASEVARGRDEVVVPIVAEEIEVGRRTVETGRVQVRKTVETVEQVVNQPTIRDEVEIERIPINRPIDTPIGPRQEGDTLIVPLIEEVLVVEKRLILKEEIRITRRRVEQSNSQTVTLRSEHAVVERSDDAEPAR